jgi:hypothetical protein
MRTSFLLPVTALVALAAGCGSDIKESASRSVPQRDLTLATQTSEVKITSPLEMQRPQVQHRTVRHSRPARAPRSRPVEPIVRPADLWTPSPVPAASQPVAQPVSTAATPANDRELLPGKTVTLIPASAGPSPGPDTAGELPPARGRTMVVGGGGGTCRGRGRGPGIGAAPRPDFR